MCLEKSGLVTVCTSCGRPPRLNRPTHRIIYVYIITVCGLWRIYTHTNTHTLMLLMCICTHAHAQTRTETLYRTKAFLFLRNCNMAEMTHLVNISKRVNARTIIVIIIVFMLLLWTTYTVCTRPLPSTRLLLPSLHSYFISLSMCARGTAHHTVQCINKICITQELKIKLNGRYYDIHTLILYVHA